VNLPAAQHVTLCGKQLHGLRHICAFFDSRDEQYAVLTPYLKEGIDYGDQVLTILESKTHADHSARLATAGIPVADASKRGQLKVLASEDTYLQGGSFAAERMYKMLEDALTSARESGFPRVRTVGDMEWALQDVDGFEELMTYEARVNQLAPQHDCTLLCAYDINLFSGRVIADVLATHSHVLLGGMIHENPHFIDPVTYLQKLALRRKPTESPARMN
jgi:hypothetical protein